jgi:hypothetical protein
MQCASAHTHTHIYNIVICLYSKIRLPRQYQRREASIAIGGVDRAHCDHRGWQWTESRGLWTLMVESIAINSTAAIAVREMAILLPSVVSIGPSGKVNIKCIRTMQL